MILVFAYLLFLLLGVAVFIYTKDADDDFFDYDPEENLIGDAYTYNFVESDYERVEKALVDFADELAFA